MWKVKSCCGCCSIKSGIVIIGLNSVLIGAISAVSKSVLGEWDWSAPISAIVFFVTGLMLIYGAKKRKLDFVFPSLCLYFTTVIYGVPSTLIDTIQTAVETNASFTSFTISIIIVFLLSALCVHAFAVINTLYGDLVREKYAVSEIDSSADVHVCNPHQYHHL